MYIRTKIQVVLLLAAALTLGVAVLVPLDRVRLIRITDQLVEQGVAALDLDARLRVAILSARRAEDRLVNAGDQSAATEAINQTRHIAGLASDGERLVDPEHARLYRSLGEQAVEYSNAVTALARVLTQGKEALGTWKMRLNRDAEGAIDALDRLKAEARNQAGRGARGSEQFRNQENAIMTISAKTRDLRRLGTTLATHQMGTGEDTDSVSHQRVILEELLTRLGQETTGVQAQAALASARFQISSLTETVREMEARVESLGAALKDHRERTEKRAEILWASAERLHASNRAVILSLRRRAGQEAERSTVRILIVLAIGLLIVILVGLTTARQVTRRLGTVTTAAATVAGGNLNARIPSNENEVDEFNELAQSFNHMSQQVQLQQDRQGSLNRIVTALNAAVGTDELYRCALREASRVSGAHAGLLYVASEDEKVLRLAATDALQDGIDPPKSVALGAGIIGTVAVEKETRIVGHLPFSVPSISGEADESEIAVLPMLVGEELQGVVQLARTGAFPQELILFLEEVLAQVAVAVATARTWEALQHTARALERKTAELEDKGHSLQLVNQELAEASRLKSEFLANVSHELRTPLNSILGFTELVLEKVTELPDRRRRNLESVIRNAKHLMTLINDLLDLSKIESGKINVSPERFTAEALIEETLSVVQPLAADKEISLVSEVSKDLDDLYTDRGKLRQILLNLISNGIKFTEEGQVLVRATPADDRVEFAVMDTGIGIAHDELEKVFDKFHQVDSTSSRRFGGTGLGLAIARDLAGQLGGTIAATSKIKEGSAFVLSLPTLYRGATTERPGPTGADLHRPKRPVLVMIDENPQAIVRMRTALQPSGIEVKSAFNSHDGLALMRRVGATTVVIDPRREIPDDLHRETQRTEDPLLLLGVTLDSRCEHGIVLRLPATGPQQAIQNALKRAEDDQQIDTVVRSSGEPFERVYLAIAAGVTHGGNAGMEEVKG